MPISAPASRIFRRRSTSSAPRFRRSTRIARNTRRRRASPHCARRSATGTRRSSARSYQPAECVVNVGGKHSIFNAVCCADQSGRRSRYPAPYWVSYPDIVKYAGGKPVILETHAEATISSCARPRWKRSSRSRTRMVIADSPSNPSGAVIPPEEYAKDLGGLPAQGRVAARRRVLFALHLWRREAIFDRERAGIRRARSSSSVRFRRHSR